MAHLRDQEASKLEIGCFSLMGIPLAAMTLPLYIIVPTIYTESFGLPLAIVGIILVIIRIMDSISDPLVGWFSDRIKGPFGRRKSWLIFSVPFTTLGAVMVFAPPENVTPFYFASWSLVLSLSFTATYLSFSSWGAELSRDYDGRSTISAAREGMIVIGTLCATSVPLITKILGIETDDQGLFILAWFVGLGLPLTALIAFFKVKEPEDHSIKKPLHFFEGLKYLKGNRTFIRLIIAFLLNGLANGLPASLFLYFISEKLGVAEMRGSLLFGYFLAGIIGIPIWIKIAKIKNKHRTWCFAMIIACIAFAGAPFLGEGDIHLFWIITIVTGLCLGADLFLPSSIQADVVDIDTAKSGNQRTGFYFALWGFATKLALALAAGIAFPILQWTGFEAGSVTQNETSLWTLGLLYAHLPIIFKLIAITLMWHFPLDKEKLKEIRGEKEA